MSQQYYVFTKNRDEHGGFMDGCIVWWRPESKGYTYDLDAAGIYTEDDKQKMDPAGKYLCFVPKEIADAHCRRPRLAWWSDAWKDPLCDALGVDHKHNRQVPA